MHLVGLDEAGINLFFKIIGGFIIGLSLAAKASSLAVLPRKVVLHHTLYWYSNDLRVHLSSVLRPLRSTTTYRIGRSRKSVVSSRDDTSSRSLKKGELDSWTTQRISKSRWWTVHRNSYIAGLGELDVETGWGKSSFILPENHHRPTQNDLTWKQNNAEKERRGPTSDCIRLYAAPFIQK